MRANRRVTRDERPDSRNENTSRLRRRAVGLAGLGALAVVSLLVLLSPLSAATTPVASFTAPYTGAKLVQVRSPTSSGCGATLNVLVVPTFSLSTGKGVAQVASSAKTCPTADSQASYDGKIGLKGLTFSPSTSGTHNVVAAWTVTWNASASMTKAAANAGAQSTVEIFLTTKVVDTTAMKTYVGHTLFIAQKDLLAAGSWSKGAVSASYSAGVSSVPLISGHTYTVYAILGFSVQSVVPQASPTGSVVTASVDFGSLNHGASLASITVP